ncbi:hypothetical protein N7510_001105 [Penicillium lagena]|uniref:uncharacterized protein n=1 Tax=Penicillium lagena TaxID=94218 RepID=UPI00253FD473|nr:uncharacterized protein N7510_001105 [Penicillium lagena]KAJ5624796.1 hypothetical protein N7510_001105 [Penicillium lagena]
MAGPTALSARSAYRQLLRATRVAFHSLSLFRLLPGTMRRMLIPFYLDDHRVLLAARQEARQNFDQNRRVGIDTGMQINHAIEVANILRHNLVQGAREAEDESAKWRMFLTTLLYELGILVLFLGWTGLIDNFILELRIHDEIERGDNESIKVDGKSVKIHKACSS